MVVLISFEFQGLVVLKKSENIMVWDGKWAQNSDVLGKNVAWEVGYYS